MLKIRMQGTLKDMKWFQQFLEKSAKIEVLQISEAYANKGTTKYFRMYAEIQQAEK